MQDYIRLFLRFLKNKKISYPYYYNYTQYKEALITINSSIRMPPPMIFFSKNSPFHYLSGSFDFFNKQLIKLPWHRFSMNWKKILMSINNEKLFKKD